MKQSGRNLEMVIQFRGSKSATVKDVVDMRKFVSMELAHLYRRLDEQFQSTRLGQADILERLQSMKLEPADALSRESAVSCSSRRQVAM